MKTQTHLTTLPAGSPPANDRRENLNPAVANFLAAREQLRLRAQELEAEMTDLRQLLNGGHDGAVPVQTAPPPMVLPPASSPTPRRSNAGLRQAVTDLILQHGPMTKDQIVALLVTNKFPFFGKPKPALDPVLYSKKFQRNGKTFGLVVNP
jgi:hypothetical protein